MLNDKITTLQNLKDQLSEESCLKKDPFLKLGEGQAPILSYNIPQSACFSTYGNQIVKGVSNEWFLPITQEAPANNFFETVQQMEPEALQQRFAEDIQLQRTDDNLIVGSRLLRKHLDLSSSNLTAVALDEARIDPQEANKIKPLMVERTNRINEVQFARIAKQGLRPMVMEKLGGYETQVKFIKQPEQAKPYFAIVEEYSTCSFLGNYGAGRSIKTFSLLPGEKTTITVKTYKETNETRSNAENVLDSFSESSTNELEKILESETGFSDSTTSGSSSTSSSSKSGNVGGNIGVALFGIINFGASKKSESGSANSSTNSSAGTRASNVRSLNKALDKHINNSNSNRSINVNNTTYESYKEGEENATVREVANLNKSRVLNFVFRQLLQEYITITSLSNIKVAYCNGYEESLRVVDLEELDKLLEDTVLPEFIESARQTILKNYCTVFNYKDESIPFVEPIEYESGGCVGLSETEKFWRIRKDTIEKYTPTNGGLEININNPILSVKQHTLKTSSVVVDAFLGQGEALDCYNMKLQDADAIKSQLANLEQLQRLELLEEITDPAQRAEWYKKVFGNCCDVPQTQIIS